MAIEFESGGTVKRDTYTYADIKNFIDNGGTNTITGRLLPDTDTDEEIVYYHLAPVIGFRITASGSTVSVKPIPVESKKYNAYPYDEGWAPDLTLYYSDKDGNKQPIGSFKTPADYRNTSNPKSKTITGKSRTSIYIRCSNAFCLLYEGADHDKYYKIGELQLHTHNNTTPTCSVTATSGTTISVSASGSGTASIKKGTDDWQSGSSHKFTGLDKGKSYSFTARTQCSNDNCDSSKNEKTSTAISGTTWNITCTASTQGYKMLTFTGKQTAGTGGSHTNQIDYWIYKGSEEVGHGFITYPANIDANGNYTIGVTGLEPGVKYKCKVASHGIVDQNGNQDNTAMTGEVATKDPFATAITCTDGAVSATTMRAKISFGATSGSTISCTATCNGASVTKSATGFFVFTGLLPNTQYTIGYTITVSATDSYTDKNGTVHTENLTFTKSDTAAYTDTTYQAQFATIHISTKIVEFSSKCNKAGATMRQKLGNSSWFELAQNTLHRYNNLTHNKSYIISAEVKNCFAFDSDGNATAVNDSTITRTVKTLLLSLTGTVFTEHQHSITTLWQAMVDGVNKNSDDIDGTLFYFSSVKTEARKTFPFQCNNVTEGVVGTTTGDYQMDKKVYSRGLTWYYCEYAITAVICDGHNTVSLTILATTTFPYIWIHDGTRWRQAIPYIYTTDTDGVNKFVPAPGFIYDGVQWREPNGEE